MHMWATYPKDDGNGAGNDGRALRLGGLGVHRLGCRSHWLGRRRLCWWCVLSNVGCVHVICSSACIHAPTLLSSVECRTTERTGVRWGNDRLCSDRACNRIGMLCNMQGRGTVLGCVSAVCMVVGRDAGSSARRRSYSTRIAVQCIADVYDEDLEQWSGFVR